MRQPHPSPRSVTATRFVRTVVLWLIAVVLPFDGAAIAAQASRGALHVHVARAPQTLRLVDFRRTDAVPTTQHRHAAAQRHRHAFADASVVAVGDDTIDGDGLLAASTLLAALGGLPTASADWSVARGDASVPVATPWSPSSGRSERLERPPRPRRG